MPKGHKSQFKRKLKDLQLYMLRHRLGVQNEQCKEFLMLQDIDRRLSENAKQEIKHQPEVGNGKGKSS